MVGLAELCSYVGIDIGGKTQLRAMAASRHFPKTCINRVPLRLEQLCAIRLEQAFTPGPPGESHLQSFQPRAGRSMSIQLTTKTHTLALVKKSKNQGSEARHTFPVEMTSLTSHVLQLVRENVGLRGASLSTPTSVPCNLIPCSTGTLTSSF